MSPDVFIQNAHFAQKVLQGDVMLKTKPINMNGRRSIQLLTDTMLELMKENRFEDISISHLTKEAGLARNTFYAHFETKEDLMSYYIFSLFEEGLKEALAELEPEDLALLYFRVWRENVAFLDMLKENDLLHLLNRFSEHFDVYCEEYQMYTECQVSDLAAPYINSIYADVLASIVKNWMKNDRKHTPEELNGVFKEVIR